MRKLFIAVARVFGILQVYYGLAYVTSIIPIIQMFARATSSQSEEVAVTSFSGESLPYTLIGLLCTLVLTFGVAWLLLFRTTWLADKLKIPEERESDGLAKDTILLTGVMFIGLYVTVKAAPTLVSACFRPAYYGGWFFSSVLSPVLKLALGLLLAIRPRLVLSLLAKGEKTHGKRIIIGSLVILALLLVVGRGIARHPWFNRLPEYEYHSSRTLPGNTVIIPLRTNTPSDSQWYALSGVPQHPSTNGLPDFTNATIVDVIDFLKKETEFQIAAPLPSEGAAPPICPAGGTYTYGTVGRHPECSKHGILGATPSSGHSSRTTR